MKSDIWWYRNSPGGFQRGPVPVDLVEALIERGILGSEAQVLREGWPTDGWRTISSVSDFTLHVGTEPLCVESVAPASPPADLADDLAAPKRLVERLPLRVAAFAVVGLCMTASIAWLAQYSDLGEIVDAAAEYGQSSASDADIIPAGSDPTPDLSINGEAPALLTAVVVEAQRVIPDPAMATPPEIKWENSFTGMAAAIPELWNVNVIEQSSTYATYEFMASGDNTVVVLGVETNDDGKTLSEYVAAISASNARITDNGVYSANGSRWDGVGLTSESEGEMSIRIFAVGEHFWRVILLDMPDGPTSIADAIQLSDTLAQTFI
ncbi:hypothetical protein A3709_19140 [Halioglobus sp. HI00S01]|uniref:hypothetical protein n=1 Tax=Halioglobus sp. HI00S01 TaxID=1822214 RepID=UPI0007C35B66|nr:hypothetical protein [Halioglobus sp. HI00S01]KZX57741.1 hypothetical protein A3709_19140 [Halioglobus sp. HI00S01]